MLNRGLMGAETKQALNGKAPSENGMMPTEAEVNAFEQCMCSQDAPSMGNMTPLSASLPATSPMSTGNALGNGPNIQIEDPDYLAFDDDTIFVGHTAYNLSDEGITATQQILLDSADRVEALNAQYQSGEMSGDEYTMQINQVGQDLRDGLEQVISQHTTSTEVLNASLSPQLQAELDNLFSDLINDRITPDEYRTQLDQLSHAHLNQFASYQDPTKTALNTPLDVEIEEGDIIMYDEDTVFVENSAYNLNQNGMVEMENLITNSMNEMQALIDLYNSKAISAEEFAARRAVVTENFQNGLESIIETHNVSVETIDPSITEKVHRDISALAFGSMSDGIDGGDSGGNGHLNDPMAVAQIVNEYLFNFQSYDALEDVEAQEEAVAVPEAAQEAAVA